MDEVVTAAPGVVTAVPGVVAMAVAILAVPGVVAVAVAVLAVPGVVMAVLAVLAVWVVGRQHSSQQPVQRPHPQCNSRREYTQTGRMPRRC